MYLFLPAGYVGYYILGNYLCENRLTDKHIVCDTINGHVAIFEAKRAAALDNLESECDKALKQIDERMYARDFEDAYDSEHIHCYGIAFYKKRCLVKKK